MPERAFCRFPSFPPHFVLRFPRVTFRVLGFLWNGARIILEERLEAEIALRGRGRSSHESAVL
jgi:hypothetical protein